MHKGCLSLDRQLYKIKFLFNWEQGRRRHGRTGARLWWSGWTKTGHFAQLCNSAYNTIVVLYWEILRRGYIFSIDPQGGGPGVPKGASGDPI